VPSDPTGKDKATNDWPPPKAAPNYNEAYPRGYPPDAPYRQDQSHRNPGPSSSLLSH